MKEIHKFTNHLYPPIIDHMFQFHENSYNLKNFEQLESSTEKTTKMGLEKILIVAHNCGIWSHKKLRNQHLF